MIHDSYKVLLKKVFWKLNGSSATPISSSILNSKSRSCQHGEKIIDILITLLYKNVLISLITLLFKKRINILITLLKKHFLLSLMP